MEEDKPTKCYICRNEDMWGLFKHDVGQYLCGNCVHELKEETVNMVEYIHTEEWGNYELRISRPKYRFNLKNLILELAKNRDLNWLVETEVITEDDITDLAVKIYHKYKLTEDEVVLRRIK
jgi:hypothetical protein